jgi:UDP-3-O-[3-hydroxymyristoyl] glucosamine N-acyltransferase
MTQTLRAWVDNLGGELIGSSDWVVQALAPIESAREADLCFVSHAKYASQLKHTRAGCVVVPPALRDAALARAHPPDVHATWVVDKPYWVFAKLTQLWRAAHGRAKQAAGIHPSAVVDPEAHIDPTAVVGPLCVVERGARIGAHTRLTSRVTVGEDCVVGARCLLHSGVVIGADGFGFAPRDDRSWEKIEQLGAVRVGDDVEIGANTCIDRGALTDTVIGDGVKLDNLVQIGHNVEVGAHTAMAGCVGVAGSAKIGARCQIGGGAVVLGHLSIADDVVINASTTVMRTIATPGQYTGVFPIDDNATWEKNAVTLRQLHRLRERVRAIERTLPKEQQGQQP